LRSATAALHPARASRGGDTRASELLKLFDQARRGRLHSRARSRWQSAAGEVERVAKPFKPAAKKLRQHAR
jgi:hypothetical protein